jgi:hypothetical protein
VKDAGFSLAEVRALPESQVWQFTVLHDEHERIKAEQAEDEQSTNSHTDIPI